MIKLGILGCGVMGGALLECALAGNLYQADQIIISTPEDHRRRELEKKFGVRTTPNNLEVAEAASEALLLAIKPQVFDEATADLTEWVSLCENKPALISILAGVPLERLEEAFPGFPVIRTMPNAPATVGAGVTALTYGHSVEMNHRILAHRLFEAVGEVVEVPESMMDAVTGLSGSGPGFVAIIVEALKDGGVAAGLPRHVASQLALKTVLGTAQLLVKSGMHPAELRDHVTSPGGTTIAGITQMERIGLRSSLIEAVQAAAKRSAELGKT